MRKRIYTVLLMLSLIMIMSGCCISHDWQEATCTEPRTCSKCGQTEGEALGHTWVEATCTEPKTCSVCGATEGEALGHMLTEANYQEAAICEICGATEGEPLQADFEMYGLTEHLVELDKEYDYIVMCYDDHSYTTVGKIIFSNYETFTYGIPEKSGYFTITSGLPEEPGYEYKVVEAAITFGDENAMQYGEDVYCRHENYYDIVGFDDSLQDRDDGWTQFTVNWKGTDYTECMDMMVGEWEYHDDSSCTLHVIYVTRVPVGYDGYVEGFYNEQVEPDAQYIFDVDNTDTILFRFE